ncbi:toxin-antitoxin system YwqK family antitoxin [Sediminibacterium soli]|uniref:toxin-antitoxin system YwqK family antitoxin n=1 Tax=Sediminibacterium soli TaxID=2698829 RepID=UPI00137AB1D2|nr:hypothetical protein [Sediminibacterium soli]NCI45800.1 hypothetical protein [Sediminibacterium soli]
MMKRKRFLLKSIFLLVIITGVFLACSDRVKTVIIDNETRAEGNISEDSIFNGLIRFFNLKSGKLETVANYSDNKLNGERIEYNSNGTILSRSFYEKGRQNGAVDVYNEKGMRVNSYFMYFDLKVGDDISYRNSVPFLYNFYSFDGKRLFNINYDSLGNRKISDVQSDYFFYNKRTFLITKYSTNERRSEIFIYLPNPPGYNFRYSIVTVDDKYQILSEIEKLDGVNRWEIFEVNESPSPHHLAIKLEIDDPNVAGRTTMFKIIE